MEHAAFLIVGIIEYLGVICLMLSLYRFEIRYYVPQIVFAAIACGFLSHALSLAYSISAAPIIQLAVLILLLWLLFQIPLLYAFIMAVTTGTVFITVQGLTIWGITSYFFDSQSLSITSTSMYAIQLVFAALNLLLSYFFLRSRVGFTFIPTSVRDRMKWTKANLVLLSAAVLSSIILILTYLLYVETKFQWFLVVILPLILASGMVYSAVKKREYDYD